jgi:hypothetical protein
VPQAQPQPAFSEIPATSPEKVEQARDAMRQKMQEVSAASAPPVTPAPAPLMKPAPQTTAAAPGVSEAEAKQRARDAQKQADKARAEIERQQASAAKSAKAPRSQSDFERIPGPPLPISSDKQAQLEELLRKYKADEITPEQYHAARAKILSGQ